MNIIPFSNLIELFLLLILFPLILSKQSLSSSNQLFHALSSLKPLRSQTCQFKFENCIQDFSYADQLDSYCNIYSRLRDCFRSLVDDLQCSSSQTKQEYYKSRENEYRACGIASSHQSIRSSMYTSSSFKLQTSLLTTLLLFLNVIF